mgnify:CR=1 FL=1
MLTRLNRRTLLAGSLALGASGLALPRIALAQTSMIGLAVWQVQDGEITP